MRRAAKEKSVTPECHPERSETALFHRGWEAIRYYKIVHFNRTPPTTSCMSKPLLLSIQAAMKVFPTQALPV